MSLTDRDIVLADTAAGIAERLMNQSAIVMVRKQNSTGGGVIISRSSELTDRVIDILQRYAEVVGEDLYGKG